MAQCGALNVDRRMACFKCSSIRPQRPPKAPEQRSSAIYPPLHEEHHTDSAYRRAAALDSYEKRYPGRDPYTLSEERYPLAEDVYTKTHDPYTRPSDLYTRTSDPYSRPDDPYARTSDPYTQRRRDPYGRRDDPYTNPDDQYAEDMTEYYRRTAPVRDGGPTPMRGIPIIITYM